LETLIGGESGEVGDAWNRLDADDPLGFVRTKDAAGSSEKHCIFACSATNAPASEDRLDARTGDRYIYQNIT
jgi:hypothetical protein